MSDKKCEYPGCQNKASRITTTETKYIEICGDCFNRKYRS